jgi:non-lysosomal glucosylceramidase
MACKCKVNRRKFIQLSAAAAAFVTIPTNTDAVAGPFDLKDSEDHFVPGDKKLSSQWVKTLFERGEREWFRGKELETIGMPVCGITTGQVYLGGDGRLHHWDIFNQWNFSSFGDTSYAEGRKPDSPLSQGFAVRVRAGGKVMEKTLDADGFPGVRFRGEYPLGFVEYRGADDLPVEMNLEGFSPFIPLNTPDSSLPVIVMRFTARNTSAQPAEVTLAGWLENGVARHSAERMVGKRVNRAMRREGWTGVTSAAEGAELPHSSRPAIVLADFEGEDFGDWKVEGAAFGTGPASGALEGQNPVAGFAGKKFASSFHGGDEAQGKLTSPRFKIERHFINFLIGGGGNSWYPRNISMRLVVDGKTVRTAKGADDETLKWACWNVLAFEGKEARIEIEDTARGGWGHISVDQIEMDDVPAPGTHDPLDRQPDFGSMALALLDGDGETCAELPEGSPAKDVFESLNSDAPRKKEQPFEKPLVGAVGKTIRLAPGEKATWTFVAAWHFPYHPHGGNYYTNRFDDAEGVVEYVTKDFARLSDGTHRWHDTWYDSTLPQWLLDRLFSTASILATSTSRRWSNGRFWAWEGVGCCPGTTCHVWAYAHTMARLFPDLERSVREMQDYNPKAGFVEETGLIMFRGGEDMRIWTADSQPGSVLKCYREHQMSGDDAFLKRLWPRIRKSMEYMFKEDGNDDGMLEGEQFNTYDISFYGPNTLIGSLYHASLLAAIEMANDVGDTAFAERCRKVFEAGRRRTIEELYNGEYFFQIVDLDKHPEQQYGQGCLSDQIFGQEWANQVGLGYLYPEDKVRSALRAIWKYNWAPDVGPQNKTHAPGRWFAMPGEAGLLTCTWPKSKHLTLSYANEVWTGIEYQVAGHMVHEGMLTEAMAICRAVHERYHPAKRNPWNEVECGDHYARAMASYGVFLELCGYEYHGPKGHLGFAPKIRPEDFRGAFSTAEGWGAFAQKVEGGKQKAAIELKFGQLRLRTLSLGLAGNANPKGATVTVASKPVSVSFAVKEGKAMIEFAEEVAMREGDAMEIALR